MTNVVPYTPILQFIPTEARPFIKWVGGKQQLITQFENLFPTNFETYFEPFVGGGAVFFYLWNAGRLPSKVYLFDNNPELVNAYRMVRDQVENLIDVLADHQKKHNREYYYQIRSLDRSSQPLSDVEKAARTIYLNKTCYNGLYRVNSEGQFNVPMGSYTAPKILDEYALRSASFALQNVVIDLQDFRTVTELAGFTDFIYFDPPYDPVSKTASFTSYTAANFRDRDQKDLMEVFEALTAKGSYCMLSNSHTPFILDLYQKFRIEIVYAKRAVNSNGQGRGDVKEVVVLNY